MTGRFAASDCSHPTYPDYREEHGEDPARILHHGLDPRPSIRGLESIPLVRAYLDVETDRIEPRETVIAALNRRLDDLQQHRPPARDDAGTAAVATDGGVEQ